MLLRDDAQAVVRPIIRDAIMNGHDEYSSSAASSPRAGDSTEAKGGHAPKKTSSKGDSDKPPRGKKRVQFLPDGILVRIKVIPPRSNKSSSDSDGSASDSSDSDDSDSETVTDSEDFSSDRDTPSPANPTESNNKFVTMPPLLYSAKGSYDVSKSSNRNGRLVAKITGINRPTSPSQSLGKTRKARRIGSPKIDKGTKKNVKQCDRNEHVKRSADEIKNKGRKKRVPLKFKEGKISPPPAAKSNKTPPTPKPSVKLSQRRSSYTINTTKSPAVNAKRYQSTTISTSVKSLSTPTPSTSPETMSLERVSRAMQSLTMGKLYTVDGFIFPPHHANELHLPDLALTSKSEDFDQSNNGDLPSPRRSLQGNVHQQLNQSQTSLTQISPTSANRKRRYYAWQMANGNIQNTLTNTPNISQMWDNMAVNSESTDKKSLYVYKH